jgi:multisubunit Na+/H+ antiporter MnhB subunit
LTWVFIVGITLVVALMILYEWPRMNPNQKKEKAVFAILVTMEWLLAILLLFYPNLPSPTQILEVVFQPLSKFLKK